MNICLCGCVFAECVCVYLQSVCVYLQTVCVSCASFERILFAPLCCPLHVSNTLAGARLDVCILFTERLQTSVCACASVPSAWVATLAAAELSPWPWLLWATTLKRYLVSGIRFWMVTCISPGRLVFTTRSLMWTHRLGGILSLKE